ncbi:MAG TPA: MmgE/PrpD family protein [Nocardioides sp.]|nr:MmgE/PrpD family protein [Nocardioides sp.]
MGVIAAGARSPEVSALLADPSLGRDPATAAWVRGTAGTFLELDEGFRPTGHPAVHVVPAALTTAVSIHATGAELAAAVAGGYEVAARLFESFVLPKPMHPHGHFGALGAATAVAMLHGHDPVELVRLAATQPLLTGWSACYEGATARNTWAGHANRAGIHAAVLHRAGFTGSLSSHLSVVAPYAVEAGGLRAPVDPETLRIMRNYFKLHSACALTHSALDATVRAWRELDDEVGAIDRIDVATVANNLRVDRQPRPNSLSTRFSLPYAVAAAILTGETGPSAFEWRADVAELAARVHVTADPDLDAHWPRAAPARVRIVTTSGTVEQQVDNPHGHHSDPATREELRAKFERIAGPGSAFDALADLAGVTDCAALPLDPEIGV